jgi:hypothetical protein
MDAERRSGGKRGRASIDWQAAFQFYAALPPNQRDYRQVAVHFGVSARTVERHGLQERWRERANAIDHNAAVAAAAKLAEDRAAQLADIDALIEAALVSLAQQLRDGRVRLSASDLPRLYKLRRELWESPAPEAPISPAETINSAAEPSRAHKLQVLRALAEAGVLEMILQPETDDGEEAA